MERYGQSNGPLLYQLKRSLSALTQGNMEVAEYYGKIKKIWDEFFSLEGLPECSCGRCICEMMRKTAEKDAQDKLLQFLMGLNDSYEGVRSQILSQDPLPTVNRAFYLVQQIEKQRVITGSGSVDQEVNALNASKNFGKADWNAKAEWKAEQKRIKMEKLCSFCRKKGHTRDQCFKLIGYPDWFKGDKQEKVAASVMDIAGVFDSPLETEIQDDKEKISPAC